MRTQVIAVAASLLASALGTTAQTLIDLGGFVEISTRGDQAVE